MNKPVIVVEGTSDVNKLQNLVDADFVITNGSCVSRETILYIKELSIKRVILIMTDPDYPGMRIRALIKNEVPNAIDVFVDKSKSIKGKKLGVCECDDEEILRAINAAYKWNEEKVISKELITSDLFELGLIGVNSSKKRKFIESRIPVGKTNGKTLLKRLNQLGVLKEKLIEIMEEFKNDSK